MAGVAAIAAGSAFCGSLVINANSTDPAHYLDWKTKDWLAPYVPEDVAKHFPADHVDPDGLYATSCGWIEAIGHRNVPGKPALFATTPHFLDDLNLRSLEELPPLEEMKSLIESNDKNQDLPLEEPETSGN